jgi:hypothetical protein
MTGSRSSVNECRFRRRPFVFGAFTYNDGGFAMEFLLLINYGDAPTGPEA